MLLCAAEADGPGSYVVTLEIGEGKVRLRELPHRDAKRNPRASEDRFSSPVTKRGQPYQTWDALGRTVDKKLPGDLVAVGKRHVLFVEHDVDTDPTSQSLTLHARK